MNQLEMDLGHAGDWRHEMEVKRSEASALLRSLVRQAGHEGWTKTRIAEVAGISRQTVHEMLKEDR